MCRKKDVERAKS